jgi:hypothetical protein
MLGMVTLIIGGYIYFKQKVGITRWSKPFGYKVYWLSQTASHRIALIVLAWGVIFTVDALIRLFLNQSNAVSPMCYLWAFGWVIIILFINFQGRQESNNSDSKL